MRKLILFLVVLIAFGNPSVYSQSVSGKVAVTGFSKDGTVKEQTPVELFKSFKENKYKIGFSYKADGIENKGLVLFDMKTTVKKNSKIIGSSNRPSWPWLPGDMYVPAEAFDFIPMLQKDGGRISRNSKAGTLTGSYEIILEMNISSGQEIKGTVAPATILLKF